MSEPAAAGARPKLSARVIDTLRKQLMAGDIPPGRKLPTEAGLTRSFGVSRSVIREAIATLAAEGLVEPRQGAGVFVLTQPLSRVGKIGSEMDNRLSTALNVLEVRLAIEVESAALAAMRRNPSQLARIEETFVDFDQNLQAGLATGPSDFSFHRAIAEATNNPFYLEMLDSLGKRAIPCDATSPFSTELAQNEHYQRGLQREHAAILTAVAIGNAEEARAAMRQHLTRSQSRHQRRLYERASYAGLTPNDIDA